MKRFLLDTNAFLFWTSNHKRLTARARKVIESSEHEIFLSSISSWEIAIKSALGKLSLPEPPSRFVPSRIAAHALTPLSFEHSDALAIAALPNHHEDPFDRALIAQALERDLVVVTADDRFEAYGVTVEW
jgi:PIN domain nuclease of toxin-antitoxin system